MNEPRGRREARENKRVTVTAPRRSSPTPHGGVRELAESTPVGDLYLQSLMRSQLGLSLRVLIVFISLFLGLPLLFYFEPNVSRYKIFGVALPWFFLGIGFYPILIGLAWVYNRSANRIDDEFISLLGQNETQNEKPGRERNETPACGPSEAPIQPRHETRYPMEADPQP
jgi:putative solute:sodium symporter small subunit